MHDRLTRKVIMKKKIIVASGILFVLLIGLLLFFINWNNIFFKPVRSDEVIRISIKIDHLYNNNIFADIESQESISAIIDIEDLVRKNDGTNFLVKAKPWDIEIEYSLNNGEKDVRTYRGQSILVELQNEFSKIPEISKKILVE